MEWYGYALLAPAFWAMNNVFIKFLLTNKFKSNLPLIFTAISMDTIFAFIVLIAGAVVYSFPYSLLAILAGVMPLIAFWFYSKALMREEVSRVVTLFQFIPVFVVLLSALFLNELLGASRYLGIALIAFASMLISYKKASRKPFSGVLKFMIPFGLIIATYTVVDKTLVEYLNFWSVFFWNVLGTFTAALLLLVLPKTRREIVKTISAVGKKTVFTAFVGEGLYVTGTLCSLIALSLTNASLASSLFGLQPFYVFFYTLILSLFSPQILNEEINKKTLLLKIAAVTLMFIGTWLVV
ncbi:MAG: EamA family transporter [Candidatus Bathyarchaeota archaeon]|nr:EamA family transporter [Candidatus Bathyarchaeota archaeon]